MLPFEVRFSQTVSNCMYFLQSLLASVSKPTKLALGRVGMFSVASLNAIVSSEPDIDFCHSMISC